MVEEERLEVYFLFCFSCEFLFSLVSPLSNIHELPDTYWGGGESSISFSIVYTSKQLLYLVPTPKLTWTSTLGLFCLLCCEALCKQIAFMLVTVLLTPQLEVK